jgi:HprK-related kinase A
MQFRRPERHGGDTLFLRTGPFIVGLTTRIGALTAALRQLYPVAIVSDAAAFADFHVAVRRMEGVRCWIKPIIRFEHDGVQVLRPLPLSQALTLFEWGVNFTISQTVHNYLVLHAAVIERGGRAAILPAASGAGKSTLVAGLAYRGWRLLSDELTLIDLDTLELIPLARPISLKNRSISIIRDFVPDAVMSHEVKNTIKGTVALLRPPEDSINRASETAKPAWFVFPTWNAEARAELRPVEKAGSFMALCRNAVNYHIHGRRGFDALADLFDRCACLQFRYGSLDDAVEVFARLAAS